MQIYFNYPLLPAAQFAVHICIYSKEQGVPQTIFTKTIPVFINQHTIELEVNSLLKEGRYVRIITFRPDISLQKAVKINDVTYYLETDLSDQPLVAFG